MQRKKRLYVGCGLAGAPEEFIQRVFQLQHDLRSHFEILEFWKPSYPGEKKDPTTIFVFDVGQVIRADVMLGICDCHSFGLGYETATALGGCKKVLLVAQNDTTVSNFPLGINNPYCRFKRYKEWSEILALALRYLG